MTRRGFTLTELLVTMAVVGILGTALARIVINNSRFVARQEAQLQARQVVRAAVNTLSSELRSVSDGGVVAATPTAVQVRVPFAFGITCGRVGTVTLASRIPADSIQYAEAGGTGGVAWVQSNGSYAFIDGVTLQTPPAGAWCDSVGIAILPAGAQIAFDGPDFAPDGTVFYLYKYVSYSFGASALYPGRIGLFRQLESGTPEELLAPFATGASFGFLVGAGLQSRTAPPATLDSIRGLDLRLDGESLATPSGAPGPEAFSMSVHVKFMNQGP